MGQSVYDTAGSEFNIFLHTSLILIQPIQIKQKKNLSL